MFDNQINLFQNADPPDRTVSRTVYAHQYNTALHEFRSTLFKGKIFRLRKKLLKHKQDLYDLNLLKPDLRVHGSFYAGIKVVPIRSIIGSEGRATDFDMNFHPLSEAARERWVNMAIAHIARLSIPPVQLIQVGAAYFVRDGHHRISVSRAFGQTSIDAEVIVWNVSPPFPWQPEISTPGGTLLVPES